jgi:carbonic anhydrase/acetyltransferase-like protein (isoleucine patch superfamily)
VLHRLLGFQIAPSARIGISLVLARRVVLGPRSRIGHLTVIRGLDELVLAEDALMGHLNWVYAIPTGLGFFDHTPRTPALFLDKAASITRRHILDCSDTVRLGSFALVAGYHSQILTHSVNLGTGRQTVKPIAIEEYSFVGSRCILLGGSQLPHHSALMAGSTLRGRYTTPYRIYAGVAATEVGSVDPTSGFFDRPASGPW